MSHNKTLPCITWIAVIVIGVALAWYEHVRPTPQVGDKEEGVSIEGLVLESGEAKPKIVKLQLNTSETPVIKQYAFGPPVDEGIQALAFLRDEKNPPWSEPELLSRTSICFTVDDTTQAFGSSSSQLEQQKRFSEWLQWRKEALENPEDVRRFGRLGKARPLETAVRAFVTNVVDWLRGSWLEALGRAILGKESWLEELLLTIGSPRPEFTPRYVDLQDYKTAQTHAENHFRKPGSPAMKLLSETPLEFQGLQAVQLTYIEEGGPVDENAMRSFMREILISLGDKVVRVLTKVRAKGSKQGLAKLQELNQELFRGERD